GTVVGNNNYESISMLGTPIEESLELIKEIVTNKNFNYLGIHNHLVSQNTNLELWEKNIKSLSEFVLDLKINHNIRSKILDIGGGYPIKYHSPQNVPTIQEIIKKIQKHFTKLDCQLYIESGRYIMGPAAILISKIETIKIYRGKKVMIIDSSVYSSSMDTLVVGLLLNCLNISKENSQKMCEYIIRGQTPCSLDIFRRKVILPEVKEGDFIVFINAGAYNYSSDFTLVNKAQEYVI
ncbi:MAG: hypothetical protein KKF44_04150, partial [Nanoarchaeota archaeon]|nr:hypothetical protein [Nanoarchaeota archaeon]